MQVRGGEKKALNQGIDRPLLIQKHIEPIKQATAQPRKGLAHHAKSKTSVIQKKNALIRFFRQDAKEA